MCAIINKMSENRSSNSSASERSSLSSLNISADMLESTDDDSSSDEQEEYAINGNLEPYRFQPVYSSDTEPENDDDDVFVDNDNDDVNANDRMTNTEW